MPIDVSNDVEFYRAPRDLAAGDLSIKTYIVIGACLAAGLPFYTSNAKPGTTGEFFLLNNASELPPAPQRPIAEFDVQIVQILMRNLIPDESYFRLRYDDLDGYRRLFDNARQRLSHLLGAAMQWNVDFGITTFVMNFLVPQQNPLGRLMPRYDLRNMVYFFEKMNEVLHEEIKRYRNCHVLDIDQISSTYGRKFFQDDLLWPLSHASMLTDYDHALDQKRLHPPAPVSHHHPLKTGDVLSAWWAEANALYRTIRQADSVKLVVLDLDDTLWRGIVVEEGAISNDTSEGWPLGIAEAILMLKRRGIVLAIVSKNDEDKIRAVWPHVWGGRLALEDFASVKINWLQKSDNIEAVLKAVNVLPKNVVFIDDNPVERANAEAAFPGIRTLGADLYDIRRVLLWSAETQVAAITDESVRRTDMIQAQAVRETVRSNMSRAEFLDSLNIRVESAAIDTIAHPRFIRAFELINKSNQFNTTGRRWTSEESREFLAAGGLFHTFTVVDNLTHYGLVGVAVLRDGVIEQFVMSCRVIGLDVEFTVLDRIVEEARAAGKPLVSAVYKPTDANRLCADLYEKAGFVEDGPIWVRRLERRAVA